MAPGEAKKPSPLASPRGGGSPLVKRLLTIRSVKDLNGVQDDRLVGGQEVLDLNQTADIPGRDHRAVGSLNRF